MPLMEKDLLSLMEQYEHSKLPYSLGLQIFHEICKAVGEIHTAGCAHLDLKPENVLINQKDGKLEVYLCDFGSSSLNSSTVGWRGTKYYAPPELRSNDAYQTQPADLWSLGILLHVILTGTFPFHVGSDLETPNLKGLKSFPPAVQTIDKMLKYSLEEKKRNFVETVELQIGLKNYDPQRDKRFSGTIKLPSPCKNKMKFCVLGDDIHCDE